MKIFRGFHHPGIANACALTIGNFDGVHRGHQAMLALLNSEAAHRGVESCVLTFEPHPRDYFAGVHNKPELAPARVGTLRDKLTELARCGVQQTVVLPFDARLAAQTPDAFIDEVLVRGLGARYVLVGDDFRFGRQRAGDYAMLDAAGTPYVLIWPEQLRENWLGRHFPWDIGRIDWTAVAGSRRIAWQDPAARDAACLAAMTALWPSADETLTLVWGNALKPGLTLSAGAVRRHCETVRDVEIVAACAQDPEAVAAAIPEALRPPGRLQPQDVEEQADAQADQDRRHDQAGDGAHQRDPAHHGGLFITAQGQQHDTKEDWCPDCKAQQTHLVIPLLISRARRSTS